MSKSLKDKVTWFLKLTDEKGNTILHYVAQNGNKHFTEQLIAAGCDVSQINNFGDQRIRNQHDSISWFLKQTDEKGNTILHYVAQTNNVDFAEQLIEAGCDVNKTNNSGNTPLACAVINGQLDMMKKLLSFGVTNINVPCKDDNSLLHLAAEYGWPNIVEFLLMAGADVNERNGYDETPLHVAAFNSDCDKGKASNSCKTIKILIESGADLSAEDCKVETPVFNAFQTSIRCFDFILSLRPESYQQINLNCNFLYDALMYAYPKKFKRLIELELNIHAIYEGGISCLHIALNRAHYEVVEYLLKNNVDMHILNNNGLDALCYVLEPSGDQSEISYIDIDTEEFQVYNNLMRCINLLLNYGYDVNHVTGDKTPLYSVLENYSSYHSCFSRVLLKHGAKFDFEHPIVRALFDDSPNSKHALLLLRHTAMFAAQNCTDGPENFYFDKLDKSCRDYYANCRDELEVMKTMKIEETTVSFFSILVNRDIGPYTRNKLVTKAFETLNFKELFPIYHDLLTERFSKESEYQGLIREATQGLGYVLNLDENSSHMILSTILKYLNKKDLSNLAKL